MTAFKKVRLFAYGYDPEEVDDFFDLARATYEGQPGAELSVDEIQRASFDLVHRGYQCPAVDAALDRLAAAMVAKDRAEIAATRGQAEWNAQLAAQATTLYGRLTRPRGERFKPGSGGYSYDTAQVDDVLDRLTAFFDNGVPLTARDIQQAVFRRRRGKKGYDEASVDAFMRRAARVLLGAA
ncbi:DivIVA domain-containing protein [Rarobacter incanus]|uniref:DivIVA domain-containing protein n=1 Tax=Rarobacter incanus TaxID=153494 RepID=A0A542SLB9_9MICO|nr:DivIVA domain-containing protein [Rarobacter incanus]TQK75434.1 DivIVA domain-containing protein [Rarobacter incanus]